MQRSRKILPKTNRKINQNQPRKDTVVRISEDIKIVIITEFPMFKKLEKRLNVVSGYKEIIKKT